MVAHQHLSFRQGQGLTSILFDHSEKKEDMVLTQRGQLDCCSMKPESYARASKHNNNEITWASEAAQKFGYIRKIHQLVELRSSDSFGSSPQDIPTRPV